MYTFSLGTFICTTIPTYLGRVAVKDLARQNGPVPCVTAENWKQQAYLKLTDHSNDGKTFPLRRVRSVAPLNVAPEKMGNSTPQPPLRKILAQLYLIYNIIALLQKLDHLRLSSSLLFRNVIRETSESSQTNTPVPSQEHLTKHSR